MNLEMSRLPTFTFIGVDGETRLDLRKSGPDIAGRAQALRARRLAPGSSVGLVFRSGPDLVLNWLACLAAQLEPLIMQFPTEKQTREYWQASVRHTTDLTQLKCLLIEDAVAERIGEFPCDVVKGSELRGGKASRGTAREFGDFSILQLSSGTTGFRKGVRFSREMLSRHVETYNEVMRLEPQRDVIVSWLPLYHDMGYIACFVMPLMLGVPVVMIDPMDWVRQPQSLFDAIRKHAGTVCYMPNFGFEVMSRIADGKPLPSMRCWISCSEPVSPATMEKFRQKTSADPVTLIACYAMAENVFAVTQSVGIRGRRIDEAEVASCGPPIPGVELKIVDQQIWARSGSSLQSYIGGDNMCDADGFYATGDLGQLIDGELYVTGRKQDLMIQAGRKFMLSDLDRIANEVYPDGRGRIATVPISDAATGTQKPVFLVEHRHFYQHRATAAMAEKLKASAGIDHLEVHFVPPRFITKTSSGKINRRKTAADWLQVQEFAASHQSADVSLAAELQADFGAADWDAPVKKSLDSLAVVMLRLLLDRHGVAFDANKSLSALAHDGAPKTDAPDAPDAADTAVADGKGGLSVVLLGDFRAYSRLDEAHLARIEALAGCKVRIEHVCAPPSPVLLSDIIFHDYFLPRVWSEQYRHFQAAIEKIKGASALIVDDISEIHFPVAQVYPVLSHRLERDAKADFVGVRWQQYSLGHADLPCSVASGADFPPASRTTSLAHLESYLGIPMLKAALIQSFEKYTQDWEFSDRRSLDGSAAGLVPVDPDRFAESLGAWLRANGDRMARDPSVKENSISLVGLAHFCSMYMEQGALDAVLSRFGSFCIAGSRSSVPYVEKQLVKLGKPFVRVPSVEARWLEKLPPYDCLLVIGAAGRRDLPRPVVVLMGAERARFCGDPALARLEFRTLFPISSADALFCVDMDRGASRGLRRKGAAIYDDPQMVTRDPDPANAGRGAARSTRR